ncbi:DNA polymerase III subunit delta [Sporanaerobacter acetigenes]|uniref:DNA polymerase III subunit delta n=1 Tax=Sporanaerobacter acetigenes DSM 13106 TaxID=1123281 RepID=A0A1M5USU0_9FIRM|nr:DNA polymerase III subunit delta [Sporanaerobacter acetigenes]SHH66112.1 DNA polymerase III, delta subunit [Sporanaerobacter acetigenes DSM 13106]
MKCEELIVDIKNNNLKTVYIFCGEEHYFIDYSLNLIKEKYIPQGLESLNYISFEGKDTEFNEIYNACETLPFMSEKKIVVVKDLGIFSRRKKDDEEYEIESKKDEGLKEYLKTLEDYVVIIFIEKERKVDKNKSIVKTINKIGGVVDFERIKGKDLYNWIEKEFRKYNKNISYPSINYLVQYSSYLSRDGNKTLYDLENQIAQISNFARDKKEISKDDIDKIVAKSLDTNIFKLLDSIAAKDVNGSLKTFNEICILNEPLPKILFMIIRQFRLLRQCKTLKESGFGQKESMERMGIGSYEFGKISRQCKSFSYEKLDNALELCLEADEKLKSTSMNSKLVLEMLIVTLC